MYNPYQPIGPDNQPDNTVQTGWTRVETASADNPQSESPAPPPAAYVPWAAAPQPPAPREKPRRDRRKGAFAAVMAACMVFSLGCGFGGGYLASRLNSTASSSGASGGQPVFYQSVSNNTNKGSLSVAEVAAKAADSVVEINTETVSSSFYGGQRVSQSAGSGVILSADGYIVTNNHVVAGADSITVRTRDGKSYAANLVGTDPDTDLAVLKIEASGLTPAVLGSSDDLVVGETAVAIGNPLGELGGTVTSGIISALSREVTIDNQTMTLLQTNAAINPGNSGGPTFNAAGQVIGINSSIASTATSSDSAGSIGIGFAIPSNLVKRVADEIIKDGKVKHVALGVVIKSDTVEADGVTRGGATITKSSATGSAVVSGGPADKAGLKEGDTIVAFNGNAVNNNYSLLGYVRAAALGDKVTLTIVRDGKTMNVDVTLDQEESSVNGSSSSDSNGNSQNKQNNQNGNGQNGYGNGNGNGNSDGGTGDGGGFSDPFGLW